MSQRKPIWSDDQVQFPRLLSEIRATQDLDLVTLAKSMDLTIADLTELFARADAAWAVIYASVK